ncbi:MAG TPA: phosphatase PAP2 family protein [Terracidiphilus sp.]|nr:phosphatase PAP2 family protein [Terracidiphilus sp.]
MIHRNAFPLLFTSNDPVTYFIQTLIRSWRSILFAPVLAVALCSHLCAQDAKSLPDSPQPQDESSEPVTLRSTPRNILRDQEAIWTSPARLNDSNAVGPALLVLATAGLMTTDHQIMSKHFTDTSLNNHADTASTGLLGGFVAAPAIIFGLGTIHHDDHATETGILGGEAMLDSLAVNEVLKIVSMRERPTLDGAHGKFFQTNVGVDSSFASNHSILAWSSAAVIATEYRGPLTQITAYGLATGVSIARVAGRQHFPSDVLVGSAVGWMIGRYVVHRHRHAD